MPQLRSCLPEGIQGFGIEEAKGLITCHGNHRFFLPGLGFFRRIPVDLTSAKGKESVQIHGLFQLGGKGGNSLLQVTDFPGSQQSQMAAFKPGFLHMGQVPQHRKAGFPFQHGSKALMEHGGAIVQDYPHNMTFPAECQQPLYLSCQGQAGALGPQHQHHRQVQSIRQVPGAGLRR